MNSCLGYLSCRLPHSDLFSSLFLPVLHSLPFPPPPPRYLRPSLSRFYCYRLMFMICITQSTWLLFALVVAVAASLCSSCCCCCCRLCLLTVMTVIFCCCCCCCCRAVGNAKRLQWCKTDGKSLLFFRQISDKLFVAKTEMKLSCQRERGHGERQGEEPESNVFYYSKEFDGKSA